MFASPQNFSRGLMPSNNSSSNVNATNNNNNNIIKSSRDNHPTNPLQVNKVDSYQSNSGGFLGGW
jgi:hypothetical protein